MIEISTYVQLYDAKAFTEGRLHQEGRIEFKRNEGSRLKADFLAMIISSYGMSKGYLGFNKDAEVDAIFDLVKIYGYGAGGGKKEVDKGIRNWINVDSEGRPKDEKSNMISQMVEKKADNDGIHRTFLVEWDRNDTPPIMEKLSSMFIPATNDYSKAPNDRYKGYVDLFDLLEWIQESIIEDESIAATLCNVNSRLDPVSSNGSKTNADVINSLRRKLNPITAALCSILDNSYVEKGELILRFNTSGLNVLLPLSLDVTSKFHRSKLFATLIK